MIQIGLSLINFTVVAALLCCCVVASPPAPSSNRATPLGGILSDVAFSGIFAKSGVNSQAQSEYLRSVTGAPQLQNGQQLVAQQSIQVPMAGNNQLSVVQKQGISPGAANGNQLSLSQQVGFNGPLEPVGHAGQSEPTATVQPAVVANPTGGPGGNGQQSGVGQPLVAVQPGPNSNGQSGQSSTGQNPNGQGGQVGQNTNVGQTPVGQITPGQSGQTPTGSNANGQQLSPTANGGQNLAGQLQPIGGGQSSAGQQPDTVATGQNAGVIQPAQKTKDSDRPTADFTCYLIPQKTVKKSRRSLSNAYLHLTGGQI